MIKISVTLHSQNNIKMRDQFSEYTRCVRDVNGRVVEASEVEEFLSDSGGRFCDREFVPVSELYDAYLETNEPLRHGVKDFGRLLGRFGVGCPSIRIKGVTCYDVNVESEDYVGFLSWVDEECGPIPHHDGVWTPLKSIYIRYNEDLRTHALDIRAIGRRLKKTGYQSRRFPEGIRYLLTRWDNV